MIASKTLFFVFSAYSLYTFVAFGTKRRIVFEREIHLFSWSGIISSLA